MLGVLKKLQHKYFEAANKTGKFLAYQLKKRKERKLINKITEDGKEITEEKDIKEAFILLSSTLKLYSEDKKADGKIRQST